MLKGIKKDSSYSISDGKIVEGVTGSRTAVLIVRRAGNLDTAGSVKYTVNTGLSSAKTSGTQVNQDYTGVAAG